GTLHRNFSWPERPSRSQLVRSVHTWSGLLVIEFLSEVKGGGCPRDAARHTEGASNRAKGCRHRGVGRQRARKAEPAPRTGRSRRVSRYVVEPADLSALYDPGNRHSDTFTGLAE